MYKKHILHILSEAKVKQIKLQFFLIFFLRGGYSLCYTTAAQQRNIVQGNKTCNFVTLKIWFD